MGTQLRAVKVDADGRVIPNGSARKVAYWRVTLGKKMTGGQKQRRFFKTYKEASEFIETSLSARKTQGQEAFAIPAALRVEALECQKRLSAVGASLTTAVSYYLRHAVPAGGVRTFSGLCEEFMKSRRAMGCREKTLIQYESYISVLSKEFGAERVNEIRTPDIEEWLDDYSYVDSNGKPQSVSGRTKKNYLTTLKTLLNYAIDRDYTALNPALKVAAPILDERPVGVLTPEQAEQVLRRALERSTDLVPALAVGLFAGLRRSEVASLDWNEVDVNGRSIVVQGRKAKTRQRRVVHISDNLVAWLNTLAKRSGPVGPNPDAFGERLRQIVRGMPGSDDKPIVEPWPHNALRHSFGSYHYAKHKNENLTAAEMGNTPDVVHKHYRALVKSEEADRFWCILP